jgi:hypothetical protein
MQIVELPQDLNDDLKARYRAFQYEQVDTKVIHCF